MRGMYLNVCSLRMFEDTFSLGAAIIIKSSESTIINTVDIISKIIPVSILYKFKAGRYRPVGVADGAITAAIDL